MIGIINKICKYFIDEIYRSKVNSKLGFYNKIDDIKYLKKMFRINMGYDLNLINPRTFNEKLQWLKVYNRKPEFIMMVDKYKVRDYVRNKLGEEYLIPLLGVYDNPNDIDFDKLPNQFVLKCNHNSGLGMCICTDKSKLNIRKIKKQLKKGMKQDYYLTGREWPYKDVERKIICEKYMVDDKTNELRDYKFFCFNGVVDSVMIAMNRKSGHPNFYFFNREWHLLKYNKSSVNLPDDFVIEKPQNIEDMFKIAEELSKGLPFARIDLYNCNGQIYFGEITFFPDSGFDKEILPDADLKLGNMIDLSLVKENES